VSRLLLLFFCAASVADSPPLQALRSPHLPSRFYPSLLSGFSWATAVTVSTARIGGDGALAATDAVPCLCSGRGFPSPLFFWRRDH